MMIILSSLMLYSYYTAQVKEYKINEFIKVKLEGGRTMIYINNRPFRQCMYLLLNIPVDRIEEYDEIKSIDEAAVKLNRKMERNHRIISPETEFWGHCSNLQAWADNEYDTRILHRTMAFPLLKALADAGDPLARSRFKEEIAMRYATGHPTVVRFLTQNGYLHYLTEDEFESILIDIDFPSIDEFTRKISSFLRERENPDSLRQIKSLTSKFLNEFRFSYKYLILLKSMEKIPEDLRQKFVEIVINRYKNNRSFPILKFLNKTQINFENIKVKTVSYNERLIGVITANKLNLRNKMIDEIKKIKGLDEISREIEEIDLSNNRITEIKDLQRFENLKKINLKNNYIKRIENLETLKNLELIDLSGNIDIEEIPDSLIELTSLKMIKLTGCRIKKFSDSVSRYFWMGQNFRYYTDYTKDEVNYYEKTHKSKAGNSGRLYKNFVKWLFKVRVIMKEFKFDYSLIKKFEKKTTSPALWAGKPTHAFLKYL
ncbi:MAG: leucine-rich repeat domain-containing protein, partial [Candidatus Hodarchaeota archaeon]